MDYSEWSDPTACQIAADGSGALYVLSACATNLSTVTATNSSIVTKVSADGTRIVWQKNLGFGALAMAVDPSGNVYVASVLSQSAQPVSIVEKLNSGTGFIWQTTLSRGLDYMAVDSTGRLFVYTGNGGYFSRLDAAGAVDYTTQLAGGPVVGIAVDPTGTYVVAGMDSGLAWVSPDSNTTVYSTLPQLIYSTVAVAPGGDAVVYGTDSGQNWIFERIAPGGALRFSVDLPSAYPSNTSVTVDGAGNAYVASYSGPVLHPVKNSLTPCGLNWLSVIAPDGSILQTTYIPGASNNPAANSTVFVATSPSSTFLFVLSANAGFVPSRAPALPSNPFQPALLLSLSQDPSAQTFPLACVGSSATYGIGAIAPGEIVTLFGNGLGPEQGVQTTATMQSPYPVQESNVEVTFNGVPAPLLWVQDAQINAAVPWSLAGQTSAQVCVSYNTTKTNCLTWPVAAAAPGVFMADSTYAVAFNQDGTVNSAANPAQPFSTVSIFAAGLGPITPRQADGTLVGTPLPVNILAVSLETQECFSVLCGGPAVIATSYARPAGSMIAGMSMISFPAFGEFGMYLSVQPSSGQVFSNTFEVHVTL